MAEKASGAVHPDVLREIVAGTATETGEAFFDELVRHLARALNMMCAWVTEWSPESRRLKAISFWHREDGFVDGVEYDVAGTPCEPVVERLDLIHIPDNVIELFPEDSSLLPLAPASYLGVPLLDTDGSLLGHLALMHDAVMPRDLQALDIFNIFAGRAAAELRRVRREKALRDREEKLSRLFGSAMDGILELDAELRVTQLNDAARKALRMEDGAVGGALKPMLDGASHGKLAYLVKELARSADARPSLWIPDGLTFVRPDGTSFPAESTLSRYEIDGQPFYSLIFRDIDARIEADARIRTLVAEAASLRAEIESFQDFGDVVGQSAALRRVLDDVLNVAETDATILVTGETGTGKEMIAREVHRHSRRAERPLIKVNCAAVPEGLQESEFFGHEKGAFTGATERRDGRFKLADGGTLFLDEVGEMPLDLQAKLLRVLQEGEFEPVGSTRTEHVDVRLVAATNRDLPEMVKAGTFREDLLYRLNVFPIHVPPLRDRGDDVVLLAERFMAESGRRLGRPGMRIAEADAARLRRYTWPGNVRELHNVLERAMITSTDGVRLNLDRALPEAAAPSTGMPAEAGRILTEPEMRDLERGNILRALEASGWKISGVDGAAEKLGLRPNTLSSRMKALNIARPT